MECGYVPCVKMQERSCGVFPHHHSDLHQPVETDEGLCVIDLNKVQHPLFLTLNKSQTTKNTSPRKDEGTIDAACYLTHQQNNSIYINYIHYININWKKQLLTMLLSVMVEYVSCGDHSKRSAATTIRIHHHDL